MEKSEKASKGFSWADEVEREEQAGAQKAERGAADVQENPGRKLNPFGDARPRVVVLDGKGVDWRKIDLEHNHHSNLRKDKNQKENISISTASISRQQHFSLGLRCQDQNKPETQNARGLHLEQQNHNFNTLVPPLKYPPKNIVALMEQIRRGRNDRSDAGLDKSHHNRYQLNSGIGQKVEHMKFGSSTPNEPMCYWPLDAHHGMTMRDRCDLNIKGSYYARVHPNSESLHERQDMESKCKRKWYGERLIGETREARRSGGRHVLVDLNMERTNFLKNYEDRERYHQESIEDGAGRRRYDQDERYMGVTEEMQANARRQVVANHNMERNTLGNKFEGGEEHYWEYNEVGSGRRNFDQVPNGWRHGQPDVVRCGFISASEATEYGTRDRARTPCEASMEGASSESNYDRKTRMLSSSKPRPSRHRRRGKQARK